MVRIEEPRVKIETADYSNKAVRVNEDINLGMVVDSDDGEVGIALVENQAQFINDYLAGNALVVGDDITVKHAMKMLQFMPIYVTRALNTNVLAGLTDTGEVVYTDLEFNLLSYYKTLQFKDPTSPTYNALYMVVCTTGTNSGVCYYFGTKPELGDSYEYEPVSEGSTIRAMVDALNDKDQFATNKIFSVTDADGKISIVMPDGLEFTEVAFKLTASAKDYTQLDISVASISSLFLAFNSTNSAINDSDYLSINGFTYYKNNTSGNLYPYVGVPCDPVSTGTDLLLAAIDDQLGNDRGIEPVINSGTLSITLSDEVEFEISADILSFFNLYSGANLITEGNSLVVTEDEQKIIIETGNSKLVSIALNGGSKKLPKGSYIRIGDHRFEVESDSDEFPIHSSGMLLIKIIRTLTGGDLIQSSAVDNWTAFYMSTKLTSSAISENLTTNSIITGPDKVSPKLTKTTFANDAENLYKSTMKDFQLRIDDYLFYVGGYSTSNPDLTPVKISSAALTYPQFIKALRREVNKYYKMIESPSGLTLMTDDKTQFANIEFEDKGNNGLEMKPVVSTNNSGIVDNASFALINKNPAKSKKIMFTLTQSDEDPEIYTLVVSRKGVETSYTISFVSGKVDGYGRDIYYTNVNELSKYVHMIKFNGEEPITGSSELFGNEIPISTPDSTDFALAVDRFSENEGIYYDFIFDGGYANTVYGKAIFEVCKKIYAEAALTMPKVSDPAQLIDFRKTNGIDSDQGWRALYRGNWLKDTTLADFVVEESPMCAYIEKIMNNKAGRQEFAPVFGASNSAINYKPLFQFTKKSTREELLGAQIPVVIEDKSLGLYYFNLDTTLKVVDSDLSDVNNCRMINIGAHICDQQCKWYIGRFNTDDLRAEVTSTLTNLIARRLQYNQKYPLHNFKVICNESNNPTSVVEARELVVDLAYRFLPKFIGTRCSNASRISFLIAGNSYVSRTISSQVMLVA